MDEANLACYATRPSESRGRFHSEPETQARNLFQRDRDRILHAGSFRKLQFKTQVFVYHEGDYYRTRLTHSLEVAQIARSIARALKAHEDLAEALALAHDLGHTCFGHAGEFELQECMQQYGGFDHNEQTFRTVTELETRYAEFDGLNLTWETLEGLAKHNGPLLEPRSSFLIYEQFNSLELNTHAGIESQIAALSDDIAYNNHDLDDGLRAGLISMEEVLELPFVGKEFRRVLELYPKLDQTRLIHEGIRRLINLMVEDVLKESKRRLEELSPENAEALRHAGKPVVAFSETMMQNQTALRAFLFQRVYRHYRVNRVSFKVRRVVRELFETYQRQPNCLPDDWHQRLEDADGNHGAARVVADYIAGMTDRYALEAHAKLFDPYVRL